MRETLEADPALAALRMALADREPAPGLVHHSDRGSQYTCADYQAVLAAHGLVASMSKKGDCWDNAVAESFYTLYVCTQFFYCFNQRFHQFGDDHGGVGFLRRTFHRVIRLHSVLRHNCPRS